MEFTIETEGSIYEISGLVHSVSFSDRLNDGCSKLEFSCINDNPAITNGRIVRFIYGGIKFYGVVFKIGKNAKKETTFTAYDQLRYAKAKDTIVSKGETIASHAKKMCSYLGLTLGELTDTSYVLATDTKDNMTWLDIIYEGIQETLTNKGKWYMLRDEYGTVCVRNIEDYRLNLVLGDGSLCYDYNYEKSIDDSTYNLIKLISNNETAGKTDTHIIKDKSAITKYGLLQYFEELKEDINPSQAKVSAEILLRLYNRESETLSLDCLGDSNVRAGCSIFADISDIGMKKWLTVRSVTHDFIPLHKMSVEVMI